MKYLALVWAGVWRRPVRAGLLFLTIATGFFLITFLKAFDAATTQASEDAVADRLFVTSRTSQYDSLPYAHLDRIRRIPGVAAVTYGVIFAARYQNPKQPVVAFAVDSASFFEVYRDWHVPPQSLERMRARRTGMLVSRGLAFRYAWSPGDRVPLGDANWRQTSGAATWTFDIAGEFEAPNAGAMVALMNYEYLDEARAVDRGRVGAFTVRTVQGVEPSQVARSIDLEFANSAHETRTLSEAEFAHYQIQQIGDVEFVVTAIVSSALFSILLCVGAVQLQSGHERRRAFATLKALGVQGPTIAVIVVAECLIFSVGGAALGLAIAAVLLHAAPGLIGVGQIPMQTFAFASWAAGTLAILTALVPAWSAMSLVPREVFART